jgi:hypothetical protein
LLSSRPRRGDVILSEGREAVATLAGFLTDNDSGRAGLQGLTHELDVFADDWQRISRHLTHLKWMLACDIALNIVILCKLFSCPYLCA